MSNDVKFTLSYHGSDAEIHLLDLYDVSQALIGFQRSLALTTHLVLNGEIITQAPSLRNARILAQPAEDGSWKIVAAVVGAIWALGTTSKDTPIGHIIYSVYDYVVSESLGVHVDYDKSLGKLYEEYKSQQIDVPLIEQPKVDALIEKCTTAITDIHRPIIKSQSASYADISAMCGNKVVNVGTRLTRSTYEYIHEVFSSDEVEIISGRVSSYNSNTFKGRIYVPREGRPVAFELDESARSDAVVELIVRSLSVNAIHNYEDKWSTVYCLVRKNTSRSGQLKSYSILHVSHTPL